MKTFKVAAFFLEQGDELIPVPLLDGLIINREDDRQSWLIELFVKKEEEQRVRPFEKTENVSARVIITNRANDPAPFSVSIRSFQSLEQGVSILLDARLRRVRNDFPVVALSSLLEQGLAGDRLMEAFTDLIQKKS